MRQFNQILLVMVILLSLGRCRSQDMRINQIEMKRVSIEALKNYELKNEKVSIRFDKTLGSIKTIRGLDLVGEGKNIYERSNDLYNKIKYFLPEQNSKLEFKISTPKRISEQEFCISLSQYYKNIPILNGRYKLILKNDGEFISLSGRGLILSNDFSIVPTLQEEETKRSLNIPIQYSVDSKLGIIFDQDSSSSHARLIYEVKSYDYNGNLLMMLGWE